MNNMSTKPISVRLGQDEVTCLDQLVEQKIVPNYSDAIRKAIAGFYGNSNITTDQLQSTQKMYWRYLLNLLESHTDEKGQQILAILKEEISND